MKEEFTPIAPFEACALDEGGVAQTCVESYPVKV